MAAIVGMIHAFASTNACLASAFHMDQYRYLINTSHHILNQIEYSKVVAKADAEDLERITQTAVARCSELYDNYGDLHPLDSAFVITQSVEWSATRPLQLLYIKTDRSNSTHVDIRALCQCLGYYRDQALPEIAQMALSQRLEAAMPEWYRLIFAMNRSVLGIETPHVTWSSKVSHLLWQQFGALDLDP